MNTLSFPSLRAKIVRSPAVKAILDALGGEKGAHAGKFPLEIDAAEGAFAGILISLMYTACGGKILAVVPTETEAAILARDLETALDPLGRGNAPAAVFPWWGAMPYRDMPPLSAVFGERMGVLAALAAGKDGIVIVPERAFLTPLPPPDYVKRLLVTLEGGGAIDTTALAETLVSYGYTRVPRVQVRG